MKCDVHPARQEVAFSRIALVVDTRGWAYDHVAQHIKRLIERDYAVSVDVLYIDDFANELLFVEHLVAERYDLIHMFWRRYIDRVLKHCTSIGATGLFERAFCHSGLSFSVASLAGRLTIEPGGLAAESHIFHLSDGYSAVSKRFYDLCAGQPLLPKPKAVLYDRTDLIVDLAGRRRPSRRRVSNVPLNILWAGNSEYGRWLGLNDVKGVRIIRAAVEQARAAGCAIDYAEFDSQKRRASQEEIGEAMLKADVYVCASIQEGTPLPVVEAMAAGCAVITTDVGVAREIFPDQQLDLIVARDRDALAEALQRCARDPAGTAKIGSINSKAILAWCASPIHDEWVQFFSDVIAISRSEQRRQEKINLIRSCQPSKVEMRLNSLRNLIRRYPTVKALARKAYPIALPILLKFERADGPSESRLRRLKTFRQSLLNGSDRVPVAALAIHVPMWLGITASTRAMFEHTLPVPMFPDQHPDSVTDQEENEYVAILQAIGPRRLVISGGNRVHRNIAVKFRAACPESRIEVIWRGNQLAWVETRQREQFLMWVREYHSGTIAKIWTVKRGLDTLLNSQGIETELFENFHPQQIHAPRRLNGDGPIKLGVWSVTNNWQKNLLSQFLAFASDERVQLHHASMDAVVNSLLDSYAVPNLKVADGAMPRDQFLSWISKMDVNLYITMSECSPNVPLESIALGVPVVVGPTTTFFDGEPFLYDRLVVRSPDDMSVIRATVDRVLSDYDAVADAVVELGRKRDALFVETRRRLNA